MSVSKETFHTWLKVAKPYSTGVKLLHIGELFEYLTGKKFADKNGEKVTPTFNKWLDSFRNDNDSKIEKWVNEFADSNEYPYRDVVYMDCDIWVRGYLIHLTPNNINIKNDDKYWLRKEMTKNT